MKTQNWLQRLSSLFLTMAIALSVIQPGLVDSAFAKTAADETIAYDPLTGALAFVGTRPGSADVSPLANPLTGGPVRNAVALVSTYGKQLGLSNVSADLAVAKTSSETSGRSTVRYQQNYRGVPVFGGEVIVNTDAHGAMLSLTAKTSPNLNLNITPVLTADAAAAAAVQAVAKYNQVDGSLLTVGTAKLQIYDARLVNPDGSTPRLVWSMTVSNVDAGINESVLVDANSGAIVLHYNQMDVVDSSASQSVAIAALSGSPEVLGAPAIGVYNLNGAAPAANDTAGWPGTFICDQSNLTACDGVGGDEIDATNAYLNALDAYNFMKNYLGIDSLDNAGVAVKGSIHYSTSYKKNFWVTGIHVAGYGDGYTGADDMAGHAIGFGLLEYSNASGLILTHQTGAIAESLSDMWGEFIDQTNGRGTDTAGVKWLIGEDWPDGVQRSMSDPSAAPYSDADKMTSPNYYFGVDNTVSIYTNAGVNSKAVYLMTDGGTFNGKTVTGLGLAKVARIYYEVEDHLLASASNYFDLYYAIKQACYNLVATSQAGLLAQDCDQVQNALDAVEMNVTSSQTVYPVASFCPAGTSKGGTALFSESFESGTANWTITNTSSPADVWAPGAGSATNGSYHLQGPESASVASESIAEMNNSVLIPSGQPVYLFFEHWFNFESAGANYHDGGALDYSTNNGATWQSAAPLFASGQNYNGTITSGQGNPIEGQQAFIGSVSSYVSSSYNLTALAGQQVKFRWVVASDSSVAGLGWYIDNAQIYPCVVTPGIPSLVSPALNALTTNYMPTLDWSDTAPDLDHYIVQVSTSSAFTSVVYQAVITASSNTLTSALAPNTNYYWRVRAYNISNDANNWSAVRNFRTALMFPTLQTPNGVIRSLRPSFNWTDVAGAKSYTIQIATSPKFRKASLVVNFTTTNKKSAYGLLLTLASRRAYYWRVRTNGVNGPGAWSTFKSFKTP